MSNVNEKLIAQKEAEANKLRTSMAAYAAAMDNPDVAFQYPLYIESYRYTDNQLVKVMSELSSLRKGNKK